MTAAGFRRSTHFGLRFVLIAILATASNAHALSETVPAFELPTDTTSDLKGDCSYRNLYELPNDPLAHIPIYEQGETDLCYAYATAQLTEYYLRKNSSWNDEDHLNPLWIAIAYKGGHSKGIRIKKNELGHGFFHTAFNDMADLGICDPKTFEKSLAAYKGKSILTDPDFFYLYEAMWDQRARHDNFFTKKGTQEYEDAMKKLTGRADFQRISSRAFGDIMNASNLAGITSLSTVGTAEILLENELRTIHHIVKKVPEEWVAKRKKIHYLHDEVFGACTGNALLKPDLPESKSMGIGWASNAKLKRGLDQMLDAGVAEPAAVGYCSRIYNDDPSVGARGAKRNAVLPRIAKAINAKCSAHYSLVVGRRKSDAGSCQYLIRNTYGRDFWTERYDCLCEKADHSGFENCHYDKDKSPTSTRVVGCWIDEKPLLNSLFDVSILRKKELQAAPNPQDPYSDVSDDSDASW